MARPIACICPFMWAMLSQVHFAGATPFFIAAFSAGRPKASQPIGIRTLCPFIRRCRYITSLIV
jgi:hypothetical protein